MASDAWAPGTKLRQQCRFVEVYDCSDRPLEVRWKGHSLPYQIFCKDQRVSHTAIVENKRLSLALTTVKAQQDIKRLPRGCYEVMNRARFFAVRSFVFSMEGWARFVLGIRAM